MTRKEARVLWYREINRMVIEYQNKVCAKLHESVNSVVESRRRAPGKRRAMTPGRLRLGEPDRGMTPSQIDVAITNPRKGGGGLSACEAVITIARAMEYASSKGSHRAPTGDVDKLEALG